MAEGVNTVCRLSIDLYVYQLKLNSYVFYKTGEGGLWKALSNVFLSSAIILSNTIPPFQKGNFNCSQCDGLEVVSLGLFVGCFVVCSLTLCLALFYLGGNKCIRKEVINLRYQREFVQNPFSRLQSVLAI